MRYKETYKERAKRMAEDIRYLKEQKAKRDHLAKLRAERTELKYGRAIRAVKKVGRAVTDNPQSYARRTAPSRRRPTQRQRVIYVQQQPQRTVYRAAPKKRRKRRAPQRDLFDIPRLF